LLIKIKGPYAVAKDIELDLHGIYIEVMGAKVNRAQSDFKAYFGSFEELTEEQKKNFALKYDHSFRVANWCDTLARKAGWSEEEQVLAWCTGLFHDIGRFRQFLEYNTFNDSISVDHATYSVKILKEKSLIDTFSAQEQADILLAIHHHNKRVLEGKFSDRGLKLAKLLRDADKLDILKMITDYYTQPKSEPNHALTWEMPAGSSVTSEVAKQVLSGKLVDRKLLRNQMDIKTLQLSWVFDLNFKASFQLLMESRFLEKIYGTMPKSDTVIRIYRRVKVYAENKVMN
jgi:putative nucleotidyltransferase with HDIG domain